MIARPAPPHSETGFVLLGSARPTLPVLVSVPHAGRDYPQAMLADLRLPRERLEGIEDRHADMLTGAVVASGAAAIVATRARAWIDLNRDEREFDPAMIDPPPSASVFTRGARVEAGLGLIPRRIGGAEIWRGRIAAAEVASRIALVHRPYHAAIAAVLGWIRAEHGVAVLVDCHSMPPLPGADAARLVIGDRHGRAAAPRLVARVRAIAAAAGIRTAVNRPYAGGHTLDRHGAPGAHVHALQLEFDRSLYLDTELREPGTGLARSAALLAEIGQALADEILADREPLAAE